MPGSFAEQRIAFGKPIIEHPLLQRQFEDRLQGLRAASKAGVGSCESARQSMAGDAALLGQLSPVPPGSSSCEVLDSRVCSADVQMGDGSARRGGNTPGISRGALVTRGDDPCDLGGDIASPDAGWAGGHAAQKAHRLLFQHLAGKAPEAQLHEMEARVERQLSMPEVDREGTLERLFSDLASLTAEALLRERVDNE